MCGNVAQGLRRKIKTWLADCLITPVPSCTLYRLHFACRLAVSNSFADFTRRLTPRLYCPVYVAIFSLMVIISWMASENRDEDILRIVECIDGCWPELAFSYADIRKPTGEKFCQILNKFLKGFVGDSYHFKVSIALVVLYSSQHICFSHILFRLSWMTFP